MREISVRQGSSTIHVICDAASARDCSIEKLQMLADQAEQILRGHIEALPPYALNDRGLKQAFSKTYATLREDPAFTQQEAAISAMVLIERPGEGQQVMAACVGDLLLYQTSPDSTGLL
ncbi:MAG: hypothetical protein KDK78_04990, partial [Chlamydiia bacterium]|nr:hypothetical protein [Chlamydiia bacterium]